MKESGNRHNAGQDRELFSKKDWHKPKLNSLSMSKTANANENAGSDGTPTLTGS
jgi:hypothetical protein